MKKQMVIPLMAMLAGCACVKVSEVQYMRINELHRKGISWSQNPPENYQPVVSMAPAVWWSLLPGAAQIFIQDKIGDASEAGFFHDQYSHAQARAKLRGKGALMLAVSWFPYIYDITQPFGLGGAIQDVNRINNLALLDFLDRQAQSKGVQ